MSCHGTSCHVICHVICHATPFHAMSHQIMSCYAILCHMISHHVMSCHTMPCHVTSHVMSIMSCHATPCHAMSHHVMSCNIHCKSTVCGHAPSIDCILADPQKHVSLLLFLQRKVGHGACISHNIRINSEPN